MKMVETILLKNFTPSIKILLIKQGFDQGIDTFKNEEN